MLLLAITVEINNAKSFMCDHGSMSQYLTHCSAPDIFGNAMASTQKEESAIVAQACLCSGQNATRIFTSVLRVATAASEVI